MQMGIVRSGKRATPESHVRTLRVCTRLLSGTSRMLSTLLAAALIENSVAWPTRRKSLPDPPASAASASAPALVPSPFDDFLRDNPMAPWSTSTSTSRIRMFPSPRGSIGLQAVAFGALRSAVGLPAQGDGGPADRRGATPTPPPPARSARTPAPLELFPVPEALATSSRCGVDGSREARDSRDGTTTRASSHSKGARCENSSFCRAPSARVREERREMGKGVIIAVPRPKC